MEQDRFLIFCCELKIFCCEPTIFLNVNLCLISINNVNPTPIKIRKRFANSVFIHEKLTQLLKRKLINEK